MVDQVAPGAPPDANTDAVAAESSRRSLGQRLRGLPWFPIIVVALILFSAVFVDLIVPHNPLLGSLRDHDLPPAWLEEGRATFLLGTDHYGRDILSRVVAGARISLLIAVVSIVLGGTVGTFLGLVAGHFGGWLEEIIMRLVDIQLSIPTILVALVALVVFGSSFEVLVILIGLWLWPNYARIVRGEVMRIRTHDYVALARIAGASTWRLLFVHELPGVFSTLIVMATLQAGWVILLEGSLSFLGVGLPPPTPSWGSMIAEGRGSIATQWWISFFPGIAMMLTVLSLNLLGDWLRNVLDPKRVIA